MISVIVCSAPCRIYLQRTDRTQAGQARRAVKGLYFNIFTRHYAIHTPRLQRVQKSAQQFPLSSLPDLCLAWRGKPY